MEAEWNLIGLLSPAVAVVGDIAYSLLLLLAFGLTSATVIIHAFGTFVAIAHLSRVWQRNKGNQGAFVLVIQILRVVSVLLLLHWVEAGLWAGFFLASGALPDLETATY